MKQITVISILQPWASLIVMGAKKIETRSWDTQFKGELYIHASLGKSYGPEKLSCRELCYKEPFKQFINGGLSYDKLPFGQIIGKVSLIDTIMFDLYRGMINNEMECSIGGNIFNFSEQELAFGDYSPNRYGWLLSHPEPIEPIPAKGKQGFWNFQLIDKPEPIRHIKTPDWWNDLYTDGTGNSFSDADPGL
jgi:hypothetical protein